jgi:hypothetical protein
MRVNLLNPEHAAIGRVLWVKLDKVVQVFLLLRSGASTLGSYERNLSRDMKTSFYCKGCADNPIIFKQFGSHKNPIFFIPNWFAKNPIYLKHTSEQ